MSQTILGLSPEQWGAIAQVTTAFFALVALTVGLPHWIGSRRALKREIVNDLFREYSREEMWQAVNLLHQSFKDATGKRAGDASVDGKDKRKWINYYKDNYTKNHHKLHLARRRVSFFYQRIAFWTKGRYMTKVVQEFWSKDDQPIVINVLLPIETVAMHEIFYNENYPNGVQVWNYNYPMWKLWSFWKEKKNSRWWQFKKLLWRDWNAASDHSEQDA
jgi:hypothetical protein